MSGLSASGLATGIDSASLINQLMYLERSPQRVLSSKQKTLQSRVDVLTQINTALSSLKDIAAGMNTASSLRKMTASVGDSTVVSATSSSTALVGAHDISITATAKFQRQVSDLGYASDSAQNFNTGTIIVSGGATPVSVSITAGNNSLSGIAAAINASGANVTASIINDGTATPYRLVVSGKDTTNYTLDFSGLTTAPTAPAGAAYANPTITQSGATYQAGSPASFSIDGISFTKTSNTVTDAIPGVTLNLLKQGATTSVTVSNNSSAVKESIDSFVKSFNDAMTLINKQSTYDSTNKKASVLSGDSTVRMVKSQLQSLVSTPVSGVTGAYSLLADIGITTNRTDGTLKVDSSKLTAALENNFDSVVELFTKNTGTSGLESTKYGVSEQFKQVLDKMTHSYEGPESSFNGIISTRIRGLNDSISGIDKQIESMEARMEQKEANLKKQFTSLETMVSSITSQGNALLTYLSSL